MVTKKKAKKRKSKEKPSAHVYRAPMKEPAPVEVHVATECEATVAAPCLSIPIDPLESDFNDYRAAPAPVDLDDDIDSGMPWWGWALIGVGVIGLLTWWGFS
jgi:hypothetical protein